MRLLLDSDILLDIALDRASFVESSEAILKLCQHRRHLGILAWHTIANVYYLLRKTEGDATTRVFLRDLIEFCAVARGSADAVRQALELKMNDFEDALQVSAGLAEASQFIITRNTKHYRRSPLPPLTPQQFLTRFHSR